MVFFGLILSKTQQDTSNIARRIRRMIESLYDYIECETDNLQDITIKGGGRLKFTNAKPNATRGLNAVSALLIDEVAFIDEVDEIYKAVTPTMAASGDKAKCILLSTPNSQADFFFDKLSANNPNKDVLSICQDIRNDQLPPVHYFTDKKGMCKFFLHYKAHPIYGSQSNYLESLSDKYQMSESAVQQEFNLSFTDSQISVFDSELIKKVCIGCYLEKDDKGIYYMGLDTSLLGSDYTVLTVLQKIEDAYHLVKMYRKRKETHEYHIFQLSDIIDDYKPIKVGVEVNSSGQIYFERLSSNSLNTEFTAIKTTASSKPILINRLILALERNLLVLPDDKNLIQEFLSFRKVGNKLEASDGKHDDIIMSLAFAVNELPVWNY